MKYQEPMAKHTSWRVGGPADNFYIPADLDDLQAFLKSIPGDESCLWLGLGSNLLIRDGGYRGTVISVTGVLADLSVVSSGVVRAGAGVTCARLARFAADEGYSGVEFLAGIPGSPTGRVQPVAVGAG